MTALEWCVNSGLAGLGVSFPVGNLKPAPATNKLAALQVTSIYQSVRTEMLSVELNS